jgi:hypothetical protein
MCKKIADWLAFIIHRSNTIKMTLNTMMICNYAQVFLALITKNVVFVANLKTLYISIV